MLSPSNYPVKYVIEAAQKVIREYGKNKPPFLSEEMAALRNVKAIEKVDMSADGLLIPVNGGFVIYLNKNHSEIKQNFSCAHEIAHTFFFNLDESPPVKLGEIRNDKEEKLCNIAAAEMLMPMDYLRRVKKQIPSLESLLNLKREFYVSIHAMAHRITKETEIWKCIISGWEKEKGEKFRRKWMYGPKQLQLRCNSFPSLLINGNDKLGIYKAYESNEIVRTKEKLLLGRSKRTKQPVMTESYKISENFVVSLINFPRLPIYPTYPFPSACDLY